MKTLKDAVTIFSWKSDSYNKRMAYSGGHRIWKREQLDKEFERLKASCERLLHELVSFEIKEFDSGTDWGTYWFINYEWIRKCAAQ